MPKLYLGPGLSQRVHQALSRRLERFMAANAVAPGAPEFSLFENPPLRTQATAGERESEKADEQGIPHQEEGITHRQRGQRRRPIKVAQIKGS